MIPTRYQPSMDQLAEFIRKHPWWQWLTRTPLAAKMTKYALSSVIAFLLSVIAFPVVYWADGGLTTLASVVAFFAAAIPNWIMNRRWAWQQTGRAPKKQMISYAAVSAVVLVVTAYATGRTNYWVKNDAQIQNHHGLRILVVEGSFVLITVILFFVKFAIYEYVIFAEERGHGRWWHLGGRGEAHAPVEPAVEPLVEAEGPQPQTEKARAPALSAGDVA